MTLQKLKEFYLGLYKQGYETVTIAQVISDLRQVKSIGKVKEEKDNKK
jgi:hypothetical protein